MDGRLWRKVVPLLDVDFRVVVPDLPLGAHKVPLHDAADRTPPGMAQLLADFLDALDLRDVTLVGNDTGGVLCQLVATRHPERLGRLVLTPTDAFDNFLPLLFRPLQLAAKVPPLLFAAVQPLRLAPLRRLPIAFGWLSKTRTDPAVEADWVRPFFADARVRRDIVEFLQAVDTKYTLETAEALRGFGKPALIAWAREDKVFPPAHAEELARRIPGARLEWIEDAYTFVAEDQPERVAQLIRDFVREPVAV